MRLRKEENDEILEDTLEYKAAVKSVIRCEIQNLVSMFMCLMLWALQRVFPKRLASQLNKLVLCLSSK